MVGLGWVAVALDLARIYAHNQGAWNPVKSAPRRGSREVGKPIKRQPTDKLHLRHAMHCPDVIYVAFRIFY